jgi:hypothetical protein
LRSWENIGSAEMNGVVECKICGSKLRPVSKAYDRQHSVKQPNWRALNVLLVLGDCTLIALQPILVYMSKVDGKFLFCPVSVNFLTEFMKVVFAVGMLLWQARKQRSGERSLLSPRVILTAARKNYLLAVPALFYAINNYLKFIMQLFFNPATVKMLSNLKVSSTYLPLGGCWKTSLLSPKSYLCYLSLYFLQLRLQHVLFRQT